MRHLVPVRCGRLACGFAAMLLAFGCGATIWSAPRQAKAPLYVYVPEMDVLIPSYGRLGADVDNLPGGGLLVKHVVTDSPAAQLNLRAGDHIKAIDGQPISTTEDAIEVLNKKGVKESTVLQVERAGDKLVLTGPLAPDYEIEARRHVRRSARPTDFVQSSSPPITRLTLDVPQDARVFLNGRLMRTGGSRRLFETTALEGAKRYKDYPVRVEVERDGRTLAQDRTVDLSAGESREMVIYFDAPTARVARR